MSTPQGHDYTKQAWRVEAEHADRDIWRLGISIFKYLEKSKTNVFYYYYNSAAL